MATNEFTPTLVSSDLIVEIIPRCFCRYRGTSAQLIAEGLIPDSFKWPERTSRKYWSSGEFTFSLERCRIPGAKGPITTWISGDYWVFEQAVEGQSNHNHYLILEKHEELNLLIHGRSPEWMKEWEKCCKAQNDSSYMAFMSQAMGDMAPRKRGRPKKCT